jgi:predicted nuclease with TOPRIM domain
MNTRIAKLKDEIEKIKVKMNKGQARLRELEKQLTDLENADIVAAVRGVEIAPDELAAFVQMFKEKQQGGTVPNMDAAAHNGISPTDVMPEKGISATDTDKDEEDLADEK